MRRVVAVGVLHLCAAGCEYEQAWGAFRHTGNVTAWDPNGEWQWAPLDGACAVEDLVGALASGDRPAWLRNTESVVLVGDSVDRFAVGDFCAEARAAVASDWRPLAAPDALATNSTSRKDVQFVGCARGVRGRDLFSVDHVKIFGLVKPCNPTMLEKIKPAMPNARERILAYVGRREVPPTLVVLHSCLWDLSVPCTTDRRPTADFARAYEAEAYATTAALRAALPHAQILWRTCPPVSRETDGKTGSTRSRQGQVVLNQALRRAVARLHRDGVVAAASPIAWDLMMLTAWDRMEETGQNPDGRHFTPPARLAYVNLVLNVLRDAREHPRKGPRP